jgi:hypothetical protein
MRKLFSLLFILLLSQAQAGFFSDLFERADETKEREFESVEEDFPNQAPIMIEEEKVFSDENFEPTQEEAVRSKTIFLSYMKNPKKVYINQHFPLEIKAVLTAQSVKSIGTEFIGGKNFQVLNDTAPWQQVDDKSYVVKYRVKLTSVDALLPSIRVVAQEGNGHKSSETLKAYPQKHVALKKDDLFTNVLAKEFHLITHHEKKYDDQSTIILLEINATGGNLEDFNLPFASRQGIDTIKEEAESQTIFYFAVIPKYQKELKFKYFNLNTNKFNRISFPIILSDSSVSTQTNLNPQKSKYFFYKVIALLSLSLILLLLYMRYKKGYLLFLALILAVYTIYTKLITNNLTIDSGVLIRILPTSNSTIFFKTTQPMEVKVLHKKNGYTKILLPNTKIGWIKDADLSKN